MQCWRANSTPEHHHQSTATRPPSPFLVFLFCASLPSHLTVSFLFFTLLTTNPPFTQLVVPVSAGVSFASSLSVKACDKRIFFFSHFHRSILPSLALPGYPFVAFFFDHPLLSLILIHCPSIICLTRLSFVAPFFDHPSLSLIFLIHCLVASHSSLTLAPNLTLPGFVSSLHLTASPVGSDKTVGRASDDERLQTTVKQTSCVNANCSFSSDIPIDSSPPPAPIAPPPTRHCARVCIRNIIARLAAPTGG